MSQQSPVEDRPAEPLVPSQGQQVDSSRVIQSLQRQIMEASLHRASLEAFIEEQAVREEGWKAEIEQLRKEVDEFSKMFVQAQSDQDKPVHKGRVTTPRKATANGKGK